MSALWEEYTQTATLSTVSSVTQQEIFHNEVDDHVFASAPITIVDGIITIITDTDDLMLVRLGIFHEIFTGGDLANVEPHHTQWWYKWHCARGPLVFRLRSKRTINPEHKLWVFFKKQQGANSTILHIGEELLMVRHQ